MNFNVCLDQFFQILTIMLMFILVYLVFQIWASWTFKNNFVTKQNIFFKGDNVFYWADKNYKLAYCKEVSLSIT